MITAGLPEDGLYGRTLVSGSCEQDGLATRRSHNLWFVCTLSHIAMSMQVAAVASPAGFDFVATPLASPLAPRAASALECGHSAFASDELVGLEGHWTGKVLGVTSSWLHPDSENETVRKDSAARLSAELAFARYCGLQAVLVPVHVEHANCSNFARKHDPARVQVLQTALQSATCMRFWVTLPLSVDPERSKRAWLWWNTVRSLCQYHSLLGITLELDEEGGHEEQLVAQLEQRWQAEPLRACTLPLSSFHLNAKGYPVLRKPVQCLVSRCFELGLQVLVSIPGSIDAVCTLARFNSQHVEPTPREAAHHPPKIPGTRTGSDSVPQAGSVAILRAHFEYLSYLFTRMPKRTGLELLAVPYHDRLQLPLQPLGDNLESMTYETFERDSPKYAHYKEAISQALHSTGMHAARARMGIAKRQDEVPLEVIVAGAGRGPLVRAALLAAEAAGVRVHVTALEKNASAVAVLRKQARCSEWAGRVDVVAADMRTWKASTLADILVSELLGSFGDNELSPECLDGASRLLRAGGICIPQAYTSHLAPVAAHVLHADLLQMEKPKRLEMPLVVKLCKHIVLAEAKPCFTFSHTDPYVLDVLGRFALRPHILEAAPDNSRHCSLIFEVDAALAPATVHGFAGYFETHLFGNVHLSTLPETHTQGMQSWFPIFFPLVCPLTVLPGDAVGLSLWRVVRGSRVRSEYCLHNDPAAFATRLGSSQRTSLQVWYEWALTAPQPSKLHNAQGKAYSISLDVDSMIRAVQ